MNEYLIVDGTGTVENVVVWDGDTGTWTPPAGTTAYPYPGGAVGVGWVTPDNGATWTMGPALLATQTLNANAQTVHTNVQANLATLQAWLAANPNGAVLTAAQTRVLARMMVGIYKLLAQDFASTTGT